MVLGLLYLTALFPVASYGGCFIRAGAMESKDRREDRWLGGVAIMRAVEIDAGDVCGRLFG